MKTLTCNQLGGPCDAKITAANEDEMMTKGMQHMHEAHPEMAAKIEATPHDDPAMVQWMETFKATWAAAPEQAE